jgi:hypothetical protein
MILNTFHLKDVTDIFDIDYRLEVEKTAMFRDNERVFVFRWKGEKKNGHWWAFRKACLHNCTSGPVMENSYVDSYS